MVAKWVVAMMNAIVITTTESAKQKTIENSTSLSSLANLEPTKSYKVRVQSK